MYFEHFSVHTLNIVLWIGSTYSYFKLLNIKNTLLLPYKFVIIPVIMCRPNTIVLLQHDKSWFAAFGEVQTIEELYVVFPLLKCVFHSTSWA